jgi:5-methyltetrahydropteroyltriglutamate--homocysteine methyltransferase
MVTAHTDVVGSLLRPQALLDARQRFEQGEIEPAEFKRIEDAAVDAAVALQERAGLDVVTDGEMRRLSFQSGLPDAVEGFGEVPLDAYLWGEWHGDEHVGDRATERPPRLGVREPLRRRRHIAAEELTYLRGRTSRIAKITLTSPSLYANLWSPELSLDAYPTLDSFLEDVVEIMRDEVRELARLGATYLQLDAPHYPLLIDPATRAFYESQGWSLERWLDRGIELDNAVIAAAPGVTFGFHLCRGNQGSRWLVSGGYDPIAPRVFRGVNAQRLLLSERRAAGRSSRCVEVPEDGWWCWGWSRTSDAARRWRSGAPDTRGGVHRPRTAGDLAGAVSHVGGRECPRRGRRARQAETTSGGRRIWGGPACDGRRPAPTIPVEAVTAQPAKGTVTDMRRVLVVAPTRRDLLNLADARVLARYDLVFEERPGVQGVFGSSDSTAALAVVVADRLGLPGPGYEAFMRCHDKLVSRRIQAEAVPEATPRFAPLDAMRPPERPPLPYPFFVKPVQGHLSQHAYEVDSDERLAEVLAAARRASFRHLIAEELLSGHLVTFEGFMHDGEVTPVGVTDAVLHANGISFLRFEYPSKLPAGPQQQMAEVASRLMPALGFHQSLFNIEFFVRADGRITIVEVNGRMASQFAPLVRAVHGVSTYELQLELAAEAVPSCRPPARMWWPPASCCAATTTRRARGAGHGRRGRGIPGRVRRAAGARGQRLSENDDDVLSHRLAVVALSGPDRDSLIERYQQAVELLPFDLAPVPARVPG